MTTTHTTDSKLQAQSDYQKALKQAFWRNVRQLLGRECNDLLSFEDVFQQLKDQPRRKLGHQRVQIEQIVGSSGRHKDFDLTYGPRRKSGDNRWVNLANAKYRGVQMPPIMLYKVGDAYFVEDGNHRVSVARQRGENFIDAYVIEIDASNLKPEPNCTRLGYKLDND